ncbi:class I SAM-dependent methyltransferase [Paenibacillus mesophilus]|uniref:class I SAM-dependent methyltransferase n=1 Tax=Paenibacillus mesophilus TaxID=2582849 RepID=UPI0013050B9A|nr:class I SAM-dependent methyltransferase [Paenibacillus mesophilus]
MAEDRITWAVSMLKTAPSDRLLEIGCGHGKAVSLICGSLIGGTITGLDRSAKMIQAAEKANAPYVASGKARFLNASLHVADLGQTGYDKIFAVNVNLFWMNADRELSCIKKRLTPGGAVYLFNQPPATEKLRHIADCTIRNLQRAGFEIKEVIAGELEPVPVIGVIAEPKQYE